MSYLKHLAVTGLFLLAAGHFYASAQIVTFFADWKKGDVRHYKITKTKEQTQGDRPKEQEITSYHARMEVTDSSESGYTLTWDLGDGFSTPNLSQEFYDSLGKYRLPQIVYKTGPPGEFLGIENWRELSEKLDSVFMDVIRLSRKEEEDTSGKFEQFLEPFRAMYNSKDAIEQLVFPEIMLVHLPYGMMLHSKKTYKYDEQLPNVLGGAPIKADGRLYVEKTEPQNPVITLVQELKLDPKSSKKMVFDFVQRLGVDNDQMKDIFKKAKLDINDSNRFLFLPESSSFPVKIMRQRSTLIYIGPVKNHRVDRVVIEPANG